MQPLPVWKLPVDESLEMIQIANTASSLDEATRPLSAGAYTTFRTFDRTKALRFHEHWTRLEQSAQLAETPVHLNRQRISEALLKAISYADAMGVPTQDELRVRLIIDLQQQVGTVYILYEPLKVPPEASYQQGVRAMTREMHRTNPKAKLTRFLETASQVRTAIPSGINEVVMVSAEGRLLEGLSSNFFAVWNGVIWTAEQGVLAGITRSMILELIQNFDIPLIREGLRLSDLPRVQELFVTSASRAVLPVTEMNGEPVGDGRPGLLSTRLLQAYQKNILQELELISS